MATRGHSSFTINLRTRAFMLPVTFKILQYVFFLFYIVTPQGCRSTVRQHLTIDIHKEVGESQRTTQKVRESHKPSACGVRRQASLEKGADGKHTLFVVIASRATPSHEWRRLATTLCHYRTQKTDSDGFRLRKNN